MEPSESFHLRWEDFGASTRDALKELREEVEFLDVTLLAGDGRRVQASKVVLAAGSPFFFKILRENPHPHPLIYLKGVNFKHLLSVSNFLYTGEVNVAQEDVKQFLEIAEDLKIKGLTPIKIQSHQNKVAASVPMETHPHSEISPPSLSSSLTHQGGQVIAEELGLSHGTSQAHSTISSPQDPVAIAATASTPWIPHSPGAMYSPRQGQAAHQEPAPEPRVSYSRGIASSRGINNVPQSTCQEDHGGKIKIEDVFAQKEPKGGTLDSSSDIVISDPTDSIFENKHYWYGQDEENSMAMAGEHDENIELDTRNFGVKEETVDSNCDIVVTEAPESELINEHSTNDCYQEDKENDVIMLDGKQNPHDKIGSSRRCKTNFVDIVSSRKYNCTQCSKKFSVLRLFNLHLKVHAVKKTSQAHSTISPQDPPEETALPPWIPHPRRVINRPLRGQATEHKSAPVPRESYSRSLATPHGSNTSQQSSSEDHSGLKLKSLKLKQNEQAIFYVIDPKEEALDSSSDIVISEATDNAFENKQLIHDWYGQDKENSMTLAREQDINIELDINVGDKKAMVDSNGVTEALESEYMSELSTNGCYEEDKDKENDVIMLNGKQNPKVCSSEKYRCMQCSKKFSFLNIFQMHLKVHAMKRKK